MAVTGNGDDGGQAEVPVTAMRRSPVRLMKSVPVQSGAVSVTVNVVAAPMAGRGLGDFGAQGGGRFAGSG